MMNEAIIFSFFRNAQTPAYRRLVIATAVAELSTLKDPVSMGKLLNRLQKDHAFTPDACEDAIAALRSVTGFNALTVWNASKTQLMRLKDSPKLNAWMEANSGIVNGVRQTLAA